ncbi:MAG: hypothetical protein KKG54_01295 [Alphaproteobacteria bacterium]|nr:hypothetical protein [Alphaproteobacteria bacterium]MBU4039211.1 hypothetical protein [Alphaproteobacteria bacterium]
MLAAAFAALAGPVWAQVEVVSPGSERTAVVIYRDRPVDTAQLLERSNQPWERLDQEGLALIVETRTIDLPAGEAVIRLRGVATGIVPQTATLDGLPAQVIERNTDFDLLSPGSLLQRSVGEVVRVVRTNPATGEQVEKAAVVRSGPMGTVLEIDGRLEALNCSGLTDRILFDGVPEGLSDQPVLSIRTRAETAGRHTVTLAYLATGLQWSADYVARLNPDGRSLALTGWITLANFGGTGFADAPVQVVAGNLNRDDDTAPVEAVEVARTPNCWPMDTTTGAPEIMAVTGSRTRREDLLTRAPVAGLAGETDMEDVIVTGSRIRARLGELGDYKIYTLPEPTDVNARQTKQVQFLEQADVRFTRTYAVTIEAGEDSEPGRPLLMLRLRNDEDGGLGLPLPGGGVSLFETQVGQILFTGQARFEDKGVGLPLELRFGEAMDLTVEQETVELETRGRAGDYDRMRASLAVTVRNDKPQAVEIEITPRETGARGFRIVRSSARSVIAPGGYPIWRLRIPAGGSQVLTYTIEYET